MTNQALTKNAGQVMNSPAITIPETATLADAAEVMVEKNIGCLPVVDAAGKVVGVVTERIFQAELAGYRPSSSMSLEERVLAQLYISGGNRLGSAEAWFEKARRASITQVMLTEEPTVLESAPLHEVAGTMLKAKLSHLVVTNDGKPVGIIARHDLLKAFVDA